ncbi:MAG: type IX secretion system outer membrane channel protein PorV [Arachidicoccus sp.]|nr:type IX secretion system outer membrane channel protein PorV [Arachidicoccus sp.]
MRFQWKKAIVLSIAVTGLSKISIAQEKPINIVQTSVPFLTISPDARSGGMANTGIANTPDAFSTFWNNAKIPFSTSNGQIGLTYTPWLSDITSDVYLLTLAGYYKPDESSAISGGVRYFNLGSIPLSLDGGDHAIDNGTANPKEFSLEAGYSRKLSDKFGVGATFRYIHSNLGSGVIDGTEYKAGNAYAFDLSGYYNGLDETGQGLTAGITLSNLGTKISYSSDADSKMFLPANFGIGGAYHAVLDDDNKLTFGLDVDHLMVPKLDTAQGLVDYYSTGVASGWGKSFNNNAYAFSLGAEYGYDDMFFLRAGYHAETKSEGDMKYFTAGVGIKYNVLKFDFAYLAPSGSGVNRNPLSNTLRFSLTFDLGSQNN